MTTQRKVDNDVREGQHAGGASAAGIVNAAGTSGTAGTDSVAAPRGDSARFLIVSPRPGAKPAAIERGDVIKASGYEAGDFDHVQIESTTDTLPDLGRYRGVVIGGSPFNVTDAEHSPEQVHLTAELLKIPASGVPALFMCFGLGLIADANGGVVDRENPETSGPVTVELTEAGRTDPLLAGLPETFLALGGHKESVTDPGPGATILATGSCPVQMIRLGESVWATQFHPEMDGPAMKNRMDLYSNHGYFTAEEYDAIMVQLAETDVSHSHRVLRNFLDYADSRA